MAPSASSGCSARWRRTSAAPIATARAGAGSTTSVAESPAATRITAAAAPGIAHVRSASSTRSCQTRGGAARLAATGRRVRVAVAMLDGPIATAARRGKGCAAPASAAQLEQAGERPLGADAHVLGDGDLGAEVAQRVPRTLERDHLHVVAELAALVEPLLWHLEQKAIGEPALGHDQELVGRALLGVAYHTAGREDGVGEREHVGAALGMDQDLDAGKGAAHRG